MKVDKTIIHPSLESMPIYGSISMHLHVSSGLVGRFGSEVSTDHGISRSWT